MTSSVPKPSWTDTGFVAPSTQTILAGVLADMNAAFGGALNVENLETPQGQLATSETAVVDQVYQALLYYVSQTDPATARGRMQDAIARIYFLSRRPATPTVVTCTCVGLQGTVIPETAQARATDGALYRCVSQVTIPASGSVDAQFENTVPGPVPCPAGTLSEIYQTIPGWDSVNNAVDGVLGSDVEGHRAFETRRAQSVAANSMGQLNSVLGAVLSVDNVVDAYVTENSTGSSETIGGVSLVAHSLYVCASGGSAQAIGEAIWSRKAPGCAYNGDTLVTVQDTAPGYVPPYPTYTVAYQTAKPLEIFLSVQIAYSADVPADANVQIQQAIVAAFAGEDGGERARIGRTVYASRFYPVVAALGTWARIVSIELDSVNNASADIQGSIAGTTLTVDTVNSGAVEVGAFLTDASGDIVSGTQVVSGSGATWAVSKTQTVGLENMLLVTPDAFDTAVNIDQIPTTSEFLIDVETVA